MKKFKSIIVAFVFCLATSIVSSQAFSAGNPVETLKITNKTDLKIYIAFAHKQTDYGGDDAEEAKDEARGWWSIEPGQTKIIKPYYYSPFFSTYYYAMTKGGKHVWGGRNNGVDKPFMVTTKKHFHYKDGGVSIRDGKRVMFRYLDTEMNKVKVLNFVLKK